MGLFDQVLGAISNPNQQASNDQLGSILGTVQQATGSQGLDSGSTQAVMSMLGSYVRSSLQQQRQTQGAGRAEAIVNQFGGTSPNQNAVQALFGMNQQQQIAQAISQRTGINSQTILALLPVLVPIVLNFLKTGATKSNVPNDRAGSNSVLNSFLDADGDGDVDIADAMGMAGRYLSQPR
ncbi:MAG: DUF937 domain-containing protein [Elainellaceae cyanobacterium]